MKLKRYAGILLILLAFTYQTQAQISGSFSVPATYPTIAAAINTLNLLGVSGPVTINISAGYTETAIPGGYKLNSITGASSVNQIFFKKNGTGANPLIYAYAGGAATPISAVQDGVWWLVGADYITIDGIDITDPNTTNPSTMEFGYGLYNASTSNGCQNNTIKNCVISLNRINGVSGNGLITGGSRGIESVCASVLQNTTAYTPSSAAGTHSYNKFYSNIIKNCHHGIALQGYQSSSPHTLSDTQNDIGGTSAVTGNTVVNYGGGVGLLSAGIRTSAQYALNVSFNIIKNNDGTGAEPKNEIYAMYLGDAPGAYTTVNSNTVSMITTSTNLVYGIFNKNGSALATMNITNNFFTGCSYPNAPDGSMIYDNSSSTLVTISGNRFRNVGGGTNSNNLIKTYGASQVSITSNTISNSSSPGIIFSINVGNTPNVIISNNLLDSAAAQSNACGVYHTFSSNPGTVTISANKMTNFSGIGCIGISTTGTAVVNSISGNTIHSISSRSGAPHGLDFTGIMCYGNNNTITANSIYSVSSTASNPVFWLTLTGIRNLGNNTLISQNKIGSFSSNVLGFIYGIYLQNGINQTITNNIIGEMQNPNSIHSDGLIGINTFNTSGTLNIYYNSIYLNSASTSTANFGSCAILLPSTGTVSLRNNILINTSASTGTGVATVIRNPTTTLNYYSAASNNNILYAGTPAANKFIYHDGVNTYTTLASFKTFVAPREAQSITENPPFMTTNASQFNFLNLDPFLPTQAESGAMPISGITTDYAGSARNSITPDIGAWEGNYSLSDVFPPTITGSGFLETVCNPGGRTFTVNLTDYSGVASGSLSPRLYYRVNSASYSSVPGNLASGTSTNGVWTFSLTYSATAPDEINYFLAAQDISIFENLAITPSLGATASNVNSVSVPPSPSYNFTLGISPTISVASATLCSGTTYTLNPSGASSYVYSSGSSVVSPLSNTVYAITGTSSLGCISTNTAIASITVVASPTITVNSGSVCAGQSFSIVPSNTSLSYTYSGGSALVSPPTTTVFTVVGENSLGCTSNSVSSSVTVNPNPTITVNSGSICSGNSFTLLPSGAASFVISGGTATVSPPTNTVFLVNGTSTAGCVSVNTATAIVTVAPLPTVSAANGTLCSGTNYTLVASGANTYAYSSGSAIVSPATNTFYTVTGTSSLGCLSSNTATANITVNTSPSITVNSGSICSGQTFTLVPSNGSLTYTYSSGLPIVSPGATTFYTVAGTNSLGCVSNFATSNVTVVANPTISVNSGTLCSGSVFTIMPSGASTYSISGGSATVNPSVNTNYTVTGSNIQGCASANTATASVTIIPLPSITASNGSICAGGVFTLNPSGAATYIYSSGTATVSPATTSTYVISGISSAGCVSSNTVTIQIIVYPLPSVNITDASNDTICSGETTTLTANGTTIYNWSNGSSSNVVTVSPGVTTTYSVTGTDANGCSATIGYQVVSEECLGLDERHKTSLQTSIYPNPNNGSFIISTNVAGEFGLYLYNIMGELVFEQNALFESGTVQIPHLVNGIYFAEVKSHGKVVSVVKIIKQ